MVADIDLNALEASLSSWEIAGYASIAAVTLGVFGEYVHDFTSWFKKISWWNAQGGKVSTLFLIASLAAELCIQVKANSISGQIIAVLSEAIRNNVDTL